MINLPMQIPYVETETANIGNDEAETVETKLNARTASDVDRNIELHQPFTNTFGIQNNDAYGIELQGNRPNTYENVFEYV